MKNLKQTFKTTKYLLIALLVAFSISCSPEDGKDGEDGAQGEQGIAGQNGNANVQTYTFDVSTLTSFSIDFPQLTQSVLDNDVVLTYIKRSDLAVGDAYFQIPGISFDNMIEVELILGSIRLYFYDRGTGNIESPIVGQYESIKAIIIPSNMGRGIETMSIYDELAEANVDITNYYAVCNYLGIEY